MGVKAEVRTDGMSPVSSVIYCWFLGALPSPLAWGVRQLILHTVCGGVSLRVQLSVSRPFILRTLGKKMKEQSPSGWFS